jgi:hypothetical protein
MRDALVSDELSGLRRDYAPPFLAYLANQNEAGLRKAYELGRDAMRRPVGLLDLVHIHNSIFLEVIGTARTPESAEDIAHAASAFLVEALASFEMTQRGFMDGEGRLEQRLVGSDRPREVRR